MNELNIEIGGAAGQGLQSAGFLLGKSFVRAGHFVFAIQDAMSRIRGGHNFFQLRVSDQPIAAMTARPDIVVALDSESVDAHESELVSGGILLYDEEASNHGAEAAQRLHMPFKKLATEIGGMAVHANTVALGAVFGLLDFDLSITKKLIEELFAGQDAVQTNIKALDAGYNYARDKRPNGFSKRIAAIEAPRRMFLTGNEAIALGAIAANCRFISAYPMSPSSSIITYLANREAQADIVTEQAEDEIAAINMAFGASLSGVRAMTATSGGGLALMVETLSLSRYRYRGFAKSISESK